MEQIVYQRRSLFSASFLETKQKTKGKSGNLVCPCYFSMKDFWEMCCFSNDAVFRPCTEQRVPFFEPVCKRCNGKATNKQGSQISIGN